ncbi:MAG: TIR domain-containing protein [Anaerolineaceae bacterium]|nr:TIR domain-containing protein [Anaerolineaceae bacterium]
MVHIFLSHSKLDREFAHFLANQIRNEMDLDKEAVFVSSEPDAIPYGEWLSIVMENLDRADVIIPLITPLSAKSTWVSFEYGYIWGQKGYKKILPLYHPKTDIPHPLQTLQGKSILDSAELLVFFNVLCENFNLTFQNKADLKAILLKALEIQIETPEELAMKQLQKKVDYLAENEFGKKLAEEMRSRGITGIH